MLKKPTHSTLLPVVASMILLLLPSASLADSLSPLAVGQTVEAALPPGDPYEVRSLFLLTPEEAGPLTIDVESLSFNVEVEAFRLEPSGEREKIAFDSESGHGHNARLGLQVEPAMSYELSVRAEENPFCGTTFKITARRGEPEEADPRDPIEDYFAYWSAASDAAERSGKPECVARAMFGKAITNPEKKGAEGRRLQRQLAEEALQYAEESLGSEHLFVAHCLFTIGQLDFALGTYDRGEPLFRRALEIRENHLGSDHIEVAKSLDGLARLLWGQGKPRDAIGLVERALRIREMHHGPVHPEVAGSLNAMGVLTNAVGDFEASLHYYERALAVEETLFGRDHPDVVQIVSNLALTCQALGLWERARELHEKALRISESFGPLDPDYATYLGKMGYYFRHIGMYAEAKEHYERALVILKKSLGVDHPLVGTYSNNLAVVLLVMGAHAEAEPVLMRSLAIKEKRLGGDSLELVAVLRNLGEVAWKLGRPEEGKELIERALRIVESSGRPDRPEAIPVLMSLAAIFQAQGMPEEARSLHERHVALARKLYGENHLELGVSLGNHAGFLRSVGELEEARRLLEEAIRGIESGVGPNHPQAAKRWKDLAGVLAQMGKRSEAFDAAIRANEIAREHLRQTIRTLPQSLALKYAETGQEALSLALSIAADGGGAAGDLPEVRAWEALAHSRALVLDEMAMRRRATSTTKAPEVARLEEDLVSSSTRLSNLIVRGPRRASAEEFRAKIDEARQARDRAEEDLARRSSQFREAVARSRADLGTIFETLPENSVLVSYGIYHQQEPEGHGTDPEGGATEAAWTVSAGAPPEAGRHYLAFTFTREKSKPTLIPLGDAREIDALVSRWQEMTRGSLDQLRSDPAGAERDYREAGRALRERSWDPITEHLGSADRAFIVPDGSLSLVSFASLPAGNSRYLIEEGPRFHYLSSERDLLADLETPPRERTLLVMGGPAFDEESLFAALAPTSPRMKGSREGRVASLTGQPVETPSSKAGSAAEGSTPVAARIRPFRGESASCEGFQEMKFRSLDAATGEVEAIASLWKDLSVDEPGGRVEPAALVSGTVLELTGAAASEAAFKSHAPGKSVLHLATHGFFLSADCAADPGSTRGIGGVVERPETGGGTSGGEDLLKLSGLALAGANHRDAVGPDEEDGILTAEEIAALDLTAAEWAVLSACDTGVGEVRTGEGVFGLRRAFHIAGAKTLIMSLWAVEDKTSRQWMTALYEGRLKRGLDTMDAVHGASMSVLRHRRDRGMSTHPFYWGGFMAAGEWR